MRTRFLALSLLSTSLVACGDDAPAPSDVRAAISSDLRHVLTEGKAASDGSTADLPSASVLGFATGALEQSGFTRVLPETIKEPKNRQAFVDGEGELDPNELINMLNNKLFTDANHVGDGVYRVPASLLCGEPADADCADAVAKAELRVRVEGEDEGLRFWLQVDMNHDEPLGFLLKSDELAMTLDLDEAGDAIAALAPLFGEEAPNVALSGEVTGSIVIKGKAQAALALSFDRAISIKLAGQGVNLDSPNAFRFASAAAQVLAIDLDGTAKQAKLDLGLGETSLHIAPEDDFDIHPTDIFLAGATMNATFANRVLEMKNISLGNKTSTISVGGMQGLAVDLNRDSGRKLDATITADAATGTETLTVAPRFDLRMTTDHAVLGDDVPVYDITRVLLEGSLKSSAFGNSVKVVTGRFSMTTNPAEYGFIASQGQCVFATENYDEEMLSSWTKYTVGSCTSELPRGPIATFAKDPLQRGETRGETATLNKLEVERGEIATISETRQ
jgi:hypothetical protein